MAGKLWKKILFIVLIVACLFNIILKLVNRNSFRQELQATLQYFTNKNVTETENTSKNEVVDATNKNTTETLSNVETTNTPNEEVQANN